MNFVYSGYKYVRDLVKTKEMQELGAYLVDVKYPERDRIGHSVNINQEKQLGVNRQPEERSDRVLDPDSDDYIDEFISSMTRVDYHAAGSCKMGAVDDTTAVVDPLLRYVMINNSKKLSIIISFSLIMLFFALLNFIE